MNTGNKTRTRQTSRSTNRHRRGLLMILFLSTSLAVGAQEPLWQINDLDQPESAVADTTSGNIYISNINGQPLEKNGQGYISVADASGSLIQKHWLTGLDAPKGLAISGDSLYIADMQTLYVVSRSSASILRKFEAPNAGMLNDVTVSDSGDVFVSDLLGGTIYRLSNAERDANPDEQKSNDNAQPAMQFTIWFSHPKVPHPNGLLWHQNSLLVANWGEGLNNDFTTRVPGTLYSLNTQTRELKPLATGYELGNLDGIIERNNQLFVSDWISGDLYRLGNNERHRAFHLNAGLADIGIQNDVLLAPMMLDNMLVAWSLGE